MRGTPNPVRRPDDVPAAVLSDLEQGIRLVAAANVAEMFARRFIRALEARPAFREIIDDLAFCAACQSLLTAEEYERCTRCNCGGDWMPEDGDEDQPAPLEEARP